MHDPVERALRGAVRHVARDSASLVSATIAPPSARLARERGDQLQVGARVDGHVPVERLHRRVEDPRVARLRVRQDEPAQRAERGDRVRDERVRDRGSETSAGRRTTVAPRARRPSAIRVGSSAARVLLQVGVVRPPVREAEVPAVVREAGRDPVRRSCRGGRPRSDERRAAVGGICDVIARPSTRPGRRVSPRRGGRCLATDRARAARAAPRPGPADRRSPPR